MCCDRANCVDCYDGICLALLGHCPSATPGCLPGGVCGAGNYHTEAQANSTYPECISCASCKNIPCIELSAYSDENCMVALLVYCNIEGYACNPAGEM
jgi:hypothetical protein